MDFGRYGASSLKHPLTNAVWARLEVDAAAAADWPTPNGVMDAVLYLDLAFVTK
jgi:hypothetical protein